MSDRRWTAAWLLPAAPLVWFFAEVGPRSLERYVDTPRAVLALVAAAGLVPGAALAGAAGAALDRCTGGALRRHRRAIALVATPIVVAPFVAAAVADQRNGATGDPPEWLVLVATAGLLAALAPLGSERRAVGAAGVLAAVLTATALVRDVLA